MIFTNVKVLKSICECQIEPVQSTSTPTRFALEFDDLG